MPPSLPPGALPEDAPPVDPRLRDTLRHLRHRQAVKRMAAQKDEQRRQPLTDEQRDRQARGKDPYTMGESGSDEEKITGRSTVSESFEERERRQFAMEVLDNYNLLMMHAHSANDSIASQRLKFRAMMCGIQDSEMEGTTATTTTTTTNTAKTTPRKGQNQARRSAGGSGSGGGGEAA